MELNHVALCYSDRKRANEFFTGILGLERKYGFTIPSELWKEIFGIEKEVEVEIFGNENLRFEIFYSELKKTIKGYEHICLEVENKEKLILKCKRNNIEFKLVKREKGKELLFINDYEGYVYEIK